MQTLNASLVLCSHSHSFCVSSVQKKHLFVLSSLLFAGLNESTPTEVKASSRKRGYSSDYRETNCRKGNSKTDPISCETVSELDPNSILAFM